MITADSKKNSVRTEGTGKELLLEMAMTVEAVARYAFQDLPEQLARSLLVDLCTTAIKSGLKSVRGEKVEADD